MEETQNTLRDGCLICLVQASDSMLERPKSGPVATKFAAALRVANRLVDDLVQFGESKKADAVHFEVGVVAYSTDQDGEPRLRELLPGSSSGVPLVRLSELALLAPAANGDGQVTWVEAESSGAAPAVTALRYAHGLLRRWAEDHPGATPPIVVHITDGESSDGSIANAVAALKIAIPGSMIVHYLFRRGMAPSSFVTIPETPCGDLWAMSSPYNGDESAQAASSESRLLFVNTLSVLRTVGQLVRRLWSGAAPAVVEAPAAEVPETAAPETAAPEAASIEETPAPEPPVVPTGPPRFETRALWAPKGGNEEAEWEDGYAENAGGGVVAVADGASDGIFSKRWAELLLESFVATPIALDDAAAVEPWIQERRAAWLKAIRYSEQRWSTQLKIDRSCGAATFVAFKLDPIPDDSAAARDAIGWTAWAVGDACLFHIRDDRLIASFPMRAAADFDCTPQLYQSKAMRATPLAVVTRGELRPKDVIVFATDALAQRLLAEVESGTPPDWGRFWEVDQEIWRQEIAALREQHAIVNDDCTLLVVRLPGATPEPEGSVETALVDESPADVPVGAGDVTGTAIAATIEPAPSDSQQAPDSGTLIEADGPAPGAPSDAIPTEEHGSTEHFHD